MNQSHWQTKRRKGWVSPGGGDSLCNRPDRYRCVVFEELEKDPTWERDSNLQWGEADGGKEEAGRMAPGLRRGTGFWAEPRGCSRPTGSSAETTQMVPRNTGEQEHASCWKVMETLQSGSFSLQVCLGLLLIFCFNYLKRKKQMHVVHLDFRNISEGDRERRQNKQYCA